MTVDHFDQFGDTALDNAVYKGNHQVAQVTTKDPAWGYFNVIFDQVCQLLKTIRNKMVPRTGRRLQERARDTPTKGLLWSAALES